MNRINDWIKNHKPHTAILAIASHIVSSMTMTAISQRTSSGPM